MTNEGRRTELQDAAIRVIAAKGGRGLTHRAVDAEAKVPTGTTSNYFRSRQALIDAIVGRIGERLTPEPEIAAALAARRPSKRLYADYLRDIVIPAQWAASKNWKGQWRQNLTSGPGVLGTASVAGGSGTFSGLESDAVEAYAARAYSAKTGPVAVDGELAIELPRQTATELAAERP